MSLPLDVMAELAQPLDRWCEFGCGHLGTIASSDGVWACEECVAQLLKAEAKYAAEALEAARSIGSAGRVAVKSKHAKAKAKRRAKRKRTKR